MKSQHINQAIILLAHGSQKKNAKRDLALIKRKLSNYLKNDSFILYNAFLQFSKPTLESCLGKILNSKFITKNLKIIILPVFVSHGRHTSFDIPKIINKMKTIYKNPNIKVALPLGSDDLLVRILYKRYKETISRHKLIKHG